MAPKRVAAADVIDKDDADMDDSDTTSSSNSGSESEEELDAELMSKLMAVEASLTDNPRNYEQHMQHISLLRQTSLRQRLREARSAMADLFPLTETMWSEWIADELEMVEDHADMERIKQLTARAVRDYLSVGLWATRLELVQQLDPAVQEGTKEGVAAFRALCEEALTAAGLHISEGSRLWSIYRCAYRQCHSFAYFAAHLS